MSYFENAKILKAEIDANRKTVQQVTDAGGIREEITQSDKIGLVIYKRGCYCLRFSFKMKVIG